MEISQFIWRRTCSHCDAHDPYRDHRRDRRPIVLNIVRILEQEARGFAMGVASHGIAAAHAISEGEIAGSFASLGMVLNAILTALVVPPVVRLIGYS